MSASKVPFGTLLRQEHVTNVPQPDTEWYLCIKVKFHYEAYRDMKDAKRRELYLKSNKGKTTLMTMLKEYFAKQNKE